MQTPSAEKVMKYWGNHPNLVSYWSMANHVRDIARNQIHGTANNMVDYFVKRQLCYRWNGNSSYISAPYSAVTAGMASAFTVFLTVRSFIAWGSHSNWVSLLNSTEESLTTDRRIMCDIENSTGKLRAYVAKGASYYIVTQTTAGVANRDYFLDISYDGAALYFYIDGIYQGMSSVAAPINWNTTKAWWFGRTRNAFSEYLNGMIRDVLFFDTYIPLSQRMRFARDMMQENNYLQYCDLSSYQQATINAPFYYQQLLRRRAA